MLEFEFNGQSSCEYGVIVASIEENDTLESRSLILGQKNKFRAKENHFGTTYDQNYSFKITLLKNPCVKYVMPRLVKKNISLTTDSENYQNTLIYDGIDINVKNNILTFPAGYQPGLVNGTLTDDNSDYFTSNDIRALNAWLTSPQFPKLLKFNNNEYFCEDLEFFVTITSVETEHIGKPYKLIYTVTCDSPYAYTAMQDQIISSTSNYKSSAVVYNNSDCLNDYVYPTIKFRPVSEGEITIKNITDMDQTLKFNLKTTDTFFMDCEKLKIYKKEKDKSSIVSFDELGISDDNISNIYWLRLVSGKNELEIKGDALITLYWREPRKVGAFA